MLLSNTQERAAQSTGSSTDAHGITHLVLCLPAVRQGVQSEMQVALLLCCSVIL